MSINESQMRVHLSDMTTTKEKGSKMPLCTSAPTEVLEVFSNYFAESRKKLKLKKNGQQMSFEVNLMMRDEKICNQLRR